MNIAQLLVRSATVFPTRTAIFHLLSQRNLLAMTSCYFSDVDSVDADSCSQREFEHREFCNQFKSSCLRMHSRRAQISLANIHKMSEFFTLFPCSP
jgi:hypothetical protein